MLHPYVRWVHLSAQNTLCELERKPKPRLDGCTIAEGILLHLPLISFLSWRAISGVSCDPTASRLSNSWATIRAWISIMMFGSAKFSLPLNRDGDFLLTPLSLLRASTVARNFNSGPDSPTAFSCVSVWRRTLVRVCDLHSWQGLPPKGAESSRWVSNRQRVIPLWSRWGHFCLLVTVVSCFNLGCVCTVYTTNP